MESVIALLGFTLAAYSVVGNDSIQTLGTFLTSNEDKPWWVLWLYAGGIMALVVTMGYLGLGEYLGGRGGDLTYGKYDKLFGGDASYPTLTWWYVLPPLVLLFITRRGIPVSTTFLVLTFFAPGALGIMVGKSLGGYVVAFLSAIIIYLAISRSTEEYFRKHPLETGRGFMRNPRVWTVLQWCATGFLWAQWLTQDLVNIMVYHGDPAGVSGWTFGLSLFILLTMLALIFYRKGGRIQDIVREKTNTADIRSASFIDLIYGVVLLVFKFNLLGVFEAKVPMSTTWVFLGLLAGRELSIRVDAEELSGRNVRRLVFSDLGKASLGLAISVALVVLMFVVQGKDLSILLGG